VAGRLALLLPLALASAAHAEGLGAVVRLEIQEPSSGDVALHIGEALRKRLATLGWRVDPSTEGPHCLVRGKISSKTAPAKRLAVRYELEALTESGTTLATLDGNFDLARPGDARDEIVNVFFSRILAARQGHPMANAVQIHDVEDDAQVQALKGLMAAAAGVAAVQSEHFSNGDLELTVDARMAAKAMADRLVEARPAGKALQIDYAGVDLLVARLR
jgi:hypothetical protein